MSLRAKLLFIFVTLAVVPALVVGIVNYLSGTRAVEALLRAEAEGRAARMARRVEDGLAAHERRLAELASEQSLRAYVRDRSSGASSSVVKPDAPEMVRAQLVAFFKNNGAHFESITCLDRTGGRLFRVAAVQGGAPQFQTEDFVATSVRHDERVWQSTRGEPLRSPLAQEPYGVSLSITVPIFAGDEGARATGALVLEVKLREVLDAAAGVGEGFGSSNGLEAHAPSTVVALDNATGRIVYHTNGALMYQPVRSAMPAFELLATKMQAGATGHGFYDAPDGDEWVAAFTQVAGLNLSLAVAENYGAAALGVRRAGALGVALPLLAGLAAIALLLHLVGRLTQRLERVAVGAAQIAKGDLNQRIEIHSTDETRVLAESFNLMSDQLREKIQRETETKQFESFTRLSAMLTHDLKNAITGLSMLVSNMERHLHREEFRADAVFGLREATEKLKRIVSRLNEPVKSLSGEYRRDARPTDLVPIIRRVLETNAYPAAALYETDARLPENLFAIVEPERIENVIENLVINALEAMGARGGRLTIEAGREDENRIYFSVADTGLGMDEEFIRLRLYRPFATTKQKGIGLGLYTCREVVETHGGKLQVESKPGAGTRFRVVLPSRRFAPEKQPRPSSGGTVES